MALEPRPAQTHRVSLRLTVLRTQVHHCLFIAPLVVMFTATRLLATYMSGGFVASHAITVGMAVQASRHRGERPNPLTRRAAARSPAMRMSVCTMLTHGGG